MSSAGNLAFRQRDMTGLENVVIVGASAAGLSAADGLREGGFDGSIVVIGAERLHPYDRPSLSKGLLLHKGDPELQELRTADRIRDNKIDLRIGHTAVGLDADRKYVVTNYGEAVPWDAVVIATGSRPRVLTTEAGQPLPVLRTPDDLRRLRQAAARFGEVSVIGAGLIGLEIGAGLSSHGVKVAVYGDARLPMEPILGHEVATVLADLHAANGVSLSMSCVVTSIRGEVGNYTLVLNDGTVRHTPFVVVGIGVNPDVEWLADSGVELDAGVLTDAAGRTNVNGVWAAGDVARSHHPMFDERVRIEHWTHAVEKGRHVGLNIARAASEPFKGVPYFWSDQHDRRFQCYGRRRQADEAFVAEGSLSENEFVILYGSDGVFHSVFASGKARSLRGYRKLLERGGSWTEATDMARAANPGLVGSLTSQ